MDFVTATVWTSTTANSSEYGKGAPWGLYTKDRKNAFAITLFLGGGTSVHDYERIPGHYHHYHVFGRDYLGTYKHFHIWYGDPT